MHKQIGSVIASKRKEKGMSQVDIANELSKYDIHVRNAAVSSWEKNNNTPTAAQLLALCEILDIADIYTEFIGDNPNAPFAELNEEGIIKAKEYIDLLRRSGLYQKQSADIIPFKPRRMKISLLPTSAGTGEYLDDENFEEVDVYEPVPENADFGVHLNGDSMEPQFKDQQLVWFEQMENLNSGDFGLFYLNGMTYFKKLLISKAGTFLISLNAKYAPIQVKEFDSFKIFARLATESV